MEGRVEGSEGATGMTGRELGSKFTRTWSVRELPEILRIMVILKVERTLVL